MGGSDGNGDWKDVQWKHSVDHPSSVESSIGWHWLGGGDLDDLSPEKLMLHRKRCLDCLTDATSRLRLRQDKLAEYVREAEHQDGYDYWLNFKEPVECVDDLVLYIKGCSE